MQLAPGDSLFDRNSERTLEMSLEYMAVKFGFFVPFVEYVEDLDGLMEYLRQRLTIGAASRKCADRIFHLLKTPPLQISVHCSSRGNTHKT